MARPIEQFTLPAGQKRLLALDEVATEFFTLATPLPAAQNTLFKVYLEGDDVVILVCLLDLGGRRVPEGTVVEVFVDPRHDHLGFYQYVFEPGHEVKCLHHLPYPEANSTAFELLRVKDYKWQSADDGGPAGVYEMTFPGWLMARFAADDFFAAGDVCGFNVARYHPSPREYSSWNPSTGYGLQDASSFGHLYRDHELCALSGAQVWCLDRQLYLAGELSHEGTNLEIELIDPLGGRQPVDIQFDGTTWQIHAWIEDPQRGRYRLCPRLEEGTIEPEFLSFEPFPERSAQFCQVGMTYDVPDDFVRSPQPYTPEALAAEMDLLLHRGVQRIHWIDYQPDHTIWSRLEPEVQERVRQTHAQCGDLLPLAAQLARERNLEFAAIYKPFDESINDRWFGGTRPPAGLCTVREAEGRPILAPGAWSDESWCMQANPEWMPDPAFPIRRLRLYSATALPDDAASQVVLYQSDDNRTYERVEVRPTAGHEARPHLVWSPAGNQPDESGSQDAWYLEWDQLEVTAGYLAVEITGDDLRLTNRAHALAEAWDANLQSYTPLIGTRGSLDEGFSFFKEWMGWNNHTCRMLSEVTWEKGVHGIAARWPRKLPTLLEPTHPDARAYWLGCLMRIVESGVDAVSIRTFCQHNNVTDYLMYAFAPCVLEEFQVRHGRPPQPEEDDYERVRRLRGEMYMRFLADAAELVRQAGVRFAVHLETGMEAPPTGRQRMEFHLDWEHLLRSGHVDEIVLKGWFPHNRYVQDRILPVARQLDVPVYVCDRNGSLINNARAIEAVTAKVGDARAAGCNGFMFYEMANYVTRSAANRAQFVPLISDALKRAYPASLL